MLVSALKSASTKRIASRCFSSYVVPPTHGLWVSGTDQPTKWHLPTRDIERIIKEVEKREETGKHRNIPPQNGVYFKNYEADVNHMVTTFQVPKLAAGMRGYDHMLQMLSRLHSNEDNDKISEMLLPFEKFQLEKDLMPGILDREETIQDDLLLGIFSQEREKDIAWMASNYTAVALAEGIRARSEKIQFCATLYQEHDLQTVAKILKPFQPSFIVQKRKKYHQIDWSRSLQRQDLTLIRKVLTALPRRVGLAYQRRGAVLVPICEVFGTPSLLFQVRSNKISFPGDVSFPGGKFESSYQRSIFDTAVEETLEEIEGLPHTIEVIAGLRCRWEEIQALSSDEWAVTPVVGWIGEIGDAKLNPSPDETAELFTVPLTYLLDENNWVTGREPGSSIFHACPKPVFGITAYILEQFLQSVVKPLQKL